MKNRKIRGFLPLFLVATYAIIVGVGCSHSDITSQMKNSEPDKQRTMSVKNVEQPNISGDWTGTWGVYLPQQTNNAAQNTQQQLDCRVVALTPEMWQATFEGECGRPYKYTIQMHGRRAGDAVLFKGSVDLGKKDGGVYNWIGRATVEGFTGFYTSQDYTGTFQMARVTESPDTKTGSL